MEVLNKDELNELERCEVVIKQGLQTFVEVGQALLTIRDKKLYRSSFRTFEEYCDVKWEIGKAYAFRLIGAAEVISNLSPRGDILPQNEKEARPLTSLEPEIQQQAWSAVVEQHGSDITAPKVREVVSDFIQVNNEIKQAKKEPMFAANTPEELLQKAKEIARAKALQKQLDREKRIEEFNQPNKFEGQEVVCFNEDCITGMQIKTLKKCSLLLTDPPYGMDFQSNYNLIEWDKIENDKLSDTVSVLDQAFFEAKKHLLPDAHFYIFGHPDYILLLKPVIEKHFTLKNMLVWDRQVIGMGDLRTYGRSYDIVYFGYVQKWKDLKGQRDRDVLSFPRVSPNNLQHPTEKPLELLDFLIKKSTQEGDYVLDPFAGSCSTLKSAQLLGRNAYGFELQKKYIPYGFSK
jgi:site-specific DNA-methyltransferase (adenine-specific)